jgi:hypothetical protein
MKVGSTINFTQLKEIQKYIEEKGHNYNQVEEIYFLAKGGESYVLRLKVKQPVEVIAKMILPSKESNQETIANILMESHMIKLLPNKEFVVDILEEIIEYKEEDKSVLNYLVLVE